MSASPHPVAVIAAQFNDRKVYLPLAAKLEAVGIGGCLRCHIDRYSTGEEGGISSQVGRSTRLHERDPDVQTYLSISDDAFDPARTDLASQHGIVHVSLSDIHPSVRTDEYVGAVVRCGRTLFLRLSTSSTKRQIQRPDGPDENAYTLLVMALLNTGAGTLTELRWSDDTRRAGRDGANWANITARAAELDVKLTFGAKTHDPREEHLLLSLLGGMNQVDDVTRIKSLTGGRVHKLLTSACPISERQLPHGIRHRRRPDGRVLIDKATRFAEADLDAHPHIVEALRRHAAGTPYVDIGIEVLARHRVPRRGQNVPPGATYADLVHNRAALSDAAQTFFVNSNRTAAGLEHLYLGKLAVWETGRYPYRLRNNLRQRGIPVGGLVPSYDGPDDVTGYFDLDLDWGTPLTGFRDDAERAEIIGKCRQRLLDERRAPRKTAGRESAAGDTRALGGPFDRWAADDPQDQRWPGDTTEYGVTTRTHNSGKNTFILVHYPSSSSRDATGRPVGLMRFANQPGRHVAGTWASDAYCASVALRIERLVEEGLLDPGAVAPMVVLPAPDRPRTDRERKRARLAAERDGARAKAEELRKDADGFERKSARKEREGDLADADRYEQLARADRAAADAEDARAQQLQDELDRLDALPATPNDVVDADISVLAYLQSGLRRAARNNGRGSHQLADAAARFIRKRRFRVRGDRIRWSCELALPLTDGGEAIVELAGDIENIRERTGKELARSELIARDVLADGRSLDEVAAQQGVTRKTLLTQRLMPWLVEHGVTSRGAKNALVDHPLPMVQRVIHARLTGHTDAAALAWGAPIADWLETTYRDAALHWGDAACPDDTTWIARAVATVTQDTQTRKHGVPVLDLALALGVSEGQVRELVKPQKRSGGFTRPRYLTYADKARTKVKAIGCPHPPCRGRRHADHVVLLPEVAASGYGVICSRCRRAPVESDAWAKRQFPREYLQHWTGRGTGDGLRAAAQTIPAAPPVPLAA
jgi:hypothetical protein